MKQNVNPIVAIGAGIGVIVVVGLVYFLISSRTPAPTAPPKVGSSAPMTNTSPGDVVRKHMEEMKQKNGGQ